MSDFSSKVNAESASQIDHSDSSWVFSDKVPEVPISTGYVMPQVGFGTYKLAPEDCSSAIEKAVEIGIRHFDTAQMYKNEAAVGKALRSTGLQREEYFLTSKLNNCNHLPDDARASLRQSLKELGTDYLDLFLIHWPLPTRYDGNYWQTWEVMLEFQQAGLVRTVGVSNFQIHHLETLIEKTGVCPAVNQVEANPHFANNQLRQFHQEHQIVTQAWSPLARGNCLQERAILQAAERLGKTPAQIVLRWGLERGDVIFPKSVRPERVVENFSIFDFSLDAQATQEINQLDKGETGRSGSHPDIMDWIG